MKSIPANVRKRIKEVLRRSRLMARIMRNVTVHEPSQCWLWTGGLNNIGYGTINMRTEGKKHPTPRQAHRVSWEVFKGRRIPKGRVIAHHYKCVSARCCNPDHLRATTQKANCRDKKRAIAWRLKNPTYWFPPTSTALKG